jgi:TIR domain
VSTDTGATGPSQPAGVEMTQEAPPAKTDRLDAFISYARRPHDREFVDWLSEELRQRGKQIWLDRSNIEPAADWRTRITKGIEQANAFIFVISPDSANSRECAKELEVAVDGHKRIIPVIFRPVPENSLPAALTTPNWISFEDEEARAHEVDELIEALESDLAWRDLSTRLAGRARTAASCSAAATCGQPRAGTRKRKGTKSSRPISSISTWRQAGRAPPGGSGHSLAA